jgi:hypothetical membrane protein
MWILSVQYFLIQLLVALSWEAPYSLTRNTISDLGNTACGNYDGRFICSSPHTLMNASFSILGIFMALGALLIYQEFKESNGSLTGFVFMAIAGVGSLLVGLFPENTTLALHLIGAGLSFLIGNLGIVILGFALNIPKSLRIYTLVTGFISLTALAFLSTHAYLGLGIGGIERITAYPQTIWLIVFGIYISKNHLKRAKN